MALDEYVMRFSTNLFWDMDKELLSMEACPTQIIQRVLEYGGMDDWRLLLSYYGLERVVIETKKMRSLDPKALSFISCISNTSKKEYRCYHTQQSNNIRWKY